MHLGCNWRISDRLLSLSSSYLQYESLLRQRTCGEILPISSSKPFLRWVLIIVLMVYFIKKIIKKITPCVFFDFYHWSWAFFSALFSGFPSRKIKIVAITGTKGKTTTTEIINVILEKAGLKTALVSSLRFKIGKESQKNLLKMTMPGRGKIQNFLKKAVDEKCQWFIMEATSEGIKQLRHRFVDLDATIFTNLSPEHIEAHGSFEKYKAAKGKLFSSRSKKKKVHIINLDDENADYFWNFEADEKIGYGITRDQRQETRDKDLRIFRASSFKLSEAGVNFKVGGQELYSPLLGEFNLYNILAAIVFARSQKIDWLIIKEAIGDFKGVRGRMQFIEEGQPFRVVIDYAHTPDSLMKFYQAIQNSKLLPAPMLWRAGKTQNSKLICVLGAAGGGRDKWKRPEMGKIAAEYCDEIILTSEDPYDENPEKILKQISSGFACLPTGGSNSKFQTPNSYFEIIDRKEAIKKSFMLAKAGDIVVITGKGSESWIMEKNGKKIPWDEEAVVKELLKE